MLEKMLPRNEALFDRVLRVVLGAVLIAAVFVGPRTAWGWLGAVLVVTGLAGSCPIYTALGLRTTSAKGTQDSV